ncbi:MAG: 4-hydroxy-tetrahydrodipicolinate reductase [Eubacterium sp.]|nr:4-hydroxy-tetrahydrodipicolinate reductase [Eubacterium sp.]
MTRIILCGANGKMGKVIQSVAAARENCEIVAGVDFNTESASFPVYKTIAEVTEEADVIIDFTNPILLEDLLDYSVNKNMPVVIATTGYDEKQKKMIEDASKKAPVFFTYNMSIGINLLANLAKKAVSVLGDDFDIEIVEKHHNQKIDAPSGTALMLADAICEEIEKPMNYEYDRHSKREKRTKNEIGLHAIRGGTIVGEHDIIFAGRDEIITLSHSSRSKEIFAVGAVNAAVFMADNKAPGMYTMKEMIE